MRIAMYTHAVYKTCAVKALEKNKQDDITWYHFYAYGNLSKDAPHGQGRADCPSRAGDGIGRRVLVDYWKTRAQHQTATALACRSRSLPTSVVLTRELRGRSMRIEWKTVSRQHRS